MRQEKKSYQLRGQTGSRPRGEMWGVIYIMLIYSSSKSRNYPIALSSKSSSANLGQQFISLFTAYPLVTWNMALRALFFDPRRRWKRGIQQKAGKQTFAVYFSSGAKLILNTLLPLISTAGEFITFSFCEQQLSIVCHLSPFFRQTSVWFAPAWWTWKFYFTFVTLLKYLLQVHFRMWSKPLYTF